MSDLHPDHEFGNIAQDVLGPPPKGVCLRLQGTGICGRPATTHVVWDTDNASPMCDEHAAEAADGAIAQHPYTRTCRIEAAQYDQRANCCVMDRDLAKADPRVQAVQAWALANYEHGTDVIVEAFEPDEILELIQEAGNEQEAIAIARDYCGVRREVENDVRGYGDLPPLPNIREQS